MTSLINRELQGGDVFLWTAWVFPPQGEFTFEIRATPFMMGFMKSILLCLLLAAAPLKASDLWSTDYAAATAQAAAEKKPVLLEFTGSDWCPPCMKQNKDVFKQPAFEDFAKDKLILVKLDFPRRKPQSPELKKRNQKLAAQYGVEGFPTIILLNSEGKELARQSGYGGGGVAGFIDWANKYLK
jgi:thiol-disulfide isomerase/thioredoxin